MTVGSASHSRQRVACTDPAKCGVRWHYADTSPLCRTGGAAAASSPLLSSAPSSMVSRHEDDTSLMTMPSDQWDSLVHAAHYDVDANDSVLSREDFDFTHDDIGYDHPESGSEYMTREKFYQQANEGRRVFDRVDFPEPMGEAETRGMVFTGCRFRGDVVLGDRSVLSGCQFDRGISDASVVEGGGRISSIVEDAKVSGDVRTSASSYISLRDLEVSGDMHLSGGNGLQTTFVSGARVDGVIYMDDSEGIVVNNFEYGNVIALRGSAEGMMAPGNSGGASYSGFSADDLDDNYLEDGREVPAVHIFSYDDLQEAQQVPGQTELDGSTGYDFDRYSEMNDRVDVLARERHKGIRSHII